MRYFLFLLIALLRGSALDALPTPIPILGPVKLVPPQCADPTYACQDLGSARQCGVVKSCIRDIWATMRAPDDNEDICALCKEMVKEARDQLLSNLTQEELKEVFEGSCKLLPIKLVADACIKLVDDFIPDLVEMLASRMDPNMVCTVAGLCNMAQLPVEEHFHSLLRLAAFNVDADRCDECTTIMTEVKTFVSQMSESEFEQMVTKLCEEGVIAPLCTTVVETYATQIYQFIITSDPKTVCTSASICPSMNRVIKVPLEHKNVGDDLVCQFCTNVLEHIKEMITANTTMDEFKTALLNFCTHLGGFSNECKSIVNDYYDMIFDYIRNMNTKAVCTCIGLCQSGLHSKNTSPLVKLFPAETIPKHAKLIRLTPSIPVKANLNSMPWVKLSPANTMSKKNFRKEADIETNDIFGNAAKSQLPMTRLDVPMITIDRNLDCPFCKAVSFFLQKDLKSDRNRDSVKHAVASVCNKWVIEFPQECSSFLQKYSVLVEDHIVESNDFDVLCTHIKACPLEKEDTGVSVKVIAPTLAPTPGLFCDICKTVFDAAAKAVTNSKTKDHIKKFLEKGCQIFREKQECIDLVDMNVEKVFVIIEENLKGDTACGVLHLCLDGRQGHLTSPLRNVECDLCKDLVQQLANTLQEPETKQAVKSTLEKGCSILPQELSTQCKTFVDENIDAIIQIIIGSLNPDVVCASLNICPDSGISVRPPSNDVECDLCKEIVQKVEDQLKDQKTEEAIKEALEEVCGYLPSSVEAKCKTFVDTYTQLLITLFLQEMDPAQICAALNICTESKKVVQPPENNDIECDLCKEVVQEVIDQLEDQKTEEAIKEALEKVCGYLPSSMEAKCKTFVDTYTDTIITLLMQEMNAEEICASLNLCPGVSVKVIAPAPARANMFCNLCKTVFDGAVKLLKDSEIKGCFKLILESGCKILPQKQDCIDLVDYDVEKLFAIIEKNLRGDVACRVLHLCVDGSQVNLTSPLRNMECDLCKDLVQQLENTLQDPETKQAVKSTLEKGCSILPQELSTQCKTFVDENIDAIIQIIVGSLNPDVVCASLNICPDSGISVRPPSNDVECDLCKEIVQKVEDQLKDQKTEEAIKEALEEVCGYLPSSVEAKCKTFVDTYTQLLITLFLQEMDPAQICAALNICTESKKVVQPPENNNIECDLCKEVVQEVIDQLEDQKTEEAIKEALEKVCGYLPSSMEAKCKTFVDTYTDTIITLLMQEMNAEEICASLNLCPESKVTKPVKSDVECDLCKQVVTIVENELKDKRTEDAIRNALDKACSLLPSSISARCQSFINTYTELLMSILVQELDPTLVCAALNVCPTQDFVCESCQYLFHYLQEQLYNNESQDELKNFAKRLCDLLPQPYSNNCDAFVDEYGSSLLVLVGQEVDPSTVCPKLGMCPSTRECVNNVIQKANVKALTLDGCQICTTVVDYIDKLLEDDDVDKEITDLVEKVCNVVPASVKDKCSAVVETYGPYILQMIGQVADSKQVCQDIDLCSRPPGHVHLLGGNKCTFGPSYWCQSKAHAAACKAEMFCTQKMWKN